MATFCATFKSAEGSRLLLAETGDPRVLAVLEPAGERSYKIGHAVNLSRVLTGSEIRVKDFTVTLCTGSWGGWIAAALLAWVGALNVAVRLPAMLDAETAPGVTRSADMAAADWLALGGKVAA